MENKENKIVFICSLQDQLGRKSQEIYKKKAPKPSLYFCINTQYTLKNGKNNIHIGIVK